VDVVIRIVLLGWCFGDAKVLTLEDWNTIMMAVIRASNWYSSIFFMMWVVFGNWILLTLFLAVVMEAFEGKYDVNEAKTKEKAAAHHSLAQRLRFAAMRQLIRVKVRLSLAGAQEEETGEHAHFAPAGDEAKVPAAEKENHARGGSRFSRLRGSSVAPEEESPAVPAMSQSERSRMVAQHQQLVESTVATGELLNQLVARRASVATAGNVAPAIAATDAAPEQSGRIDRAEEDEAVDMAQGSRLFQPFDAGGEMAQGSRLFQPLPAEGSRLFQPLPAEGSRLFQPLPAEGSRLFQPFDAGGKGAEAGGAGRPQSLVQFDEAERGSVLHCKPPLAPRLSMAEEAAAVQAAEALWREAMGQESGAVSEAFHGDHPGDGARPWADANILLIAANITGCSAYRSKQNSYSPPR
jgi:hypothetical protein